MDEKLGEGTVAAIKAGAYVPASHAAEPKQLQSPKSNKIILGKRNADEMQRSQAKKPNSEYPRAPIKLNFDKQSQIQDDHTVSEYQSQYQHEQPAEPNNDPDKQNLLQLNPIETNDSRAVTA